MGQTLSTVIGYFIIFCIKLSEKAKGVFLPEKKEKNYYNNDILLKDDEQKANILSSEEINKIIKRRRDLKDGTPEVNLNEYKMLKNSTEMDETELLTDKSYNESSTTNKEIQDLHKEVINLHIGDDKEEEEGNENNVDNIEDLKASILNHD